MMRNVGGILDLQDLLTFKYKLRLDGRVPAREV